MVKFPKLVKNEYVKVCTKVSTWVLLIFVALTAIGYNGVLRIAKAYSEKQMVQYQSQVDYIDDYKQMINDIQATNPEDAEIQIEKYQFLIDHDISYDDWRNMAAENTFNEKYLLQLDQQAGGGAGLSERETMISNKINAIAKDNWKGYYTLCVNTYQSDASLTAEQKEAYSFQYQYALKHDIDPDADCWQNDLLPQLSEKMQQLAAGSQTDGEFSAEEEQQRQKLEDEVLLLQYRLDHGLKSVAFQVTMENASEMDFWTILGLSSMLINVISLVIIIIAGGSIANEFTNGTIKFLLINPVKRWKIFLSKYVMILSMSFLLVLGFYVLNVLCTGLLFGFGDALNPYLYVADGVVQKIPGLLYILWQYLIGSVNLLVMGTLAFAISSLLRNSAVAIGVSVFALLAGSTVTMVLGGAFQMDWARFLIFANTDLNAVMSGMTMFPGMTVGFSLAVIAVHMVIFFLIAWDGFMRRESI